MNHQDTINHQTVQPSPAPRRSALCVIVGAGATILAVVGTGHNTAVGQTATGKAITTAQPMEMHDAADHIDV